MAYTFSKKSQNIVDKFLKIDYSKQKYKRTHILKILRITLCKWQSTLIFLECVFYWLILEGRLDFYDYLD